MVLMQIWDISLTLIVFVFTFLVIFFFLYNDTVITIALIVFAICVADFIMKMTRDLFLNILPLNTSDKTVLITGCDSGFGNILARQLDAKGVTVFAGCLFSEGPGAKQLKENCSKNLHVLQMDVTKDDQIKSSLQSVTKNLNGKKLWAIVNNAGIAVMAETELTSIETTRKIINVNTLGPARVTQTFLPLLRKCKGRVVIVTSIVGRLPLPGLCSYSMSKQATFCYAEVLRREILRWGVSVHTIEPYFFMTPMGDTEVVVINAKKEWNQAPDSVRADYGGDKYFDNLLEGFGLTNNKPIYMPISNLNLVTDCMMDAAIGRFPKMNYFPGFPSRIVTYGNHKLPSSIHDLIALAFLPKLIDSKKNEPE